CDVDMHSGRARVLDGTFEHWREHYGRQDIDLVALHYDPRLPKDQLYQSRAYAVEQYLSNANFDIGFVDDMSALAFYALQSKLTGTAHTNTTFVATTHGPHLWIYDVNHVPYPDASFAALVEMELFSLANVDYVLGPSRYLLEYLH